MCGSGQPRQINVVWGGYCGSEAVKGVVVGYAQDLQSRIPLLVIDVEGGGQRVLSFSEIRLGEDTYAFDLPHEFTDAVDKYRAENGETPYEFPREGEPADDLYGEDDDEDEDWNEDDEF